MVLWGHAIQGFIEKPIFGQGFDSFSRSMEKKFGRKTSAHSEYLEVLYKLGLIGFIFFVTFYFMIWKYFKDNDNLTIAKAGHYALITYFITIFFVNTSTAIYPIFMTLAIAVRYTEIKKNQLLTQKEA